MGAKKEKRPRALDAPQACRRVRHLLHSTRVSGGRARGGGVEGHGLMPNATRCSAVRERLHRAWCCGGRAHVLLGALHACGRPQRGVAAAPQQQRGAGCTAACRRAPHRSIQSRPRAIHSLWEPSCGGNQETDRGSPHATRSLFGGGVRRAKKSSTRCCPSPGQRLSVQQRHWYGCRWASRRYCGSSNL